MGTRGKSINLFLMDGTPSGRVKCTLANWTGVAYKIPRNEIDKSKGREDLSQSGVYFLFGTSDETGETVVYVGQAGVRKNGEGILYRLQEHKRNPDKDYWTEAVVFTTSNNSFGPTEISYLENRFCALANEAKRYLVKNGNEPTSGNITEEKESELEEFIDNAKIVMGTLGHKVFEKLADNKPAIEQLDMTGDNNQLLFLKRKSKKSGQVIEAECKRTNEGFVVLQGSHIETIDSESIPPGIKERRSKAQVDGNGVLQEDILFRSPSYAAAFVIGGHTNGLVDWKTSDGRTLKEFEGSE
ncbi:GIY-YIG nuclease family protein [Desulfosporosinus sp. OT]|uniref:GIY-YIG nuclease family protein n=1 Tax=Desulfosporosinus sp. OT TaxID=913865 RepID=UPI000223A6F7|nr:GIY-YIG nuclease family protein [Desulfosporosinus sp. OT]EGW40559.1 putative methionine sulfoxide reductase A [Desulfosporosinus sp. OT]